MFPMSTPPTVTLIERPMFCLRIKHNQSMIVVACTATTTTSIAGAISRRLVIVVVVVVLLFPPPIERWHIARKSRFAQLGIDQVVLPTQPLTQILSCVGLYWDLFQIVAKIMCTPNNNNNIISQVERSGGRDRERTRI
jgi:hypothetical protein